VKAKTVFVLAAAAAAIAGPAFAQAPAQAEVPPSSVRVQVRTMENVFMTAVQGGVQQIAQKITDSVPGLTVVSGVPRAHGYAVDGHGWFFDVEVPELRWATIDLFYETVRQPQPPPATPQRPVNSAAKTPASPVLIQEPDSGQLREAYRKAIRDGLMDAILDFGQVPLKAGEWLTVGARSADSALPGLDNGDTVTLVMQITGEDLALFRQTKITREEAKKRIKIKEDHR
jgi:hypothetical protein